MAINNFIPDIWSARILGNLSNTAVGAGICNSDYAGDASVGDSVKITSIVDPTIAPYTGADLVPEDIDDATRSLLLDQKQSFSFYLDDVDAAQAADGGALLAAAVDRAAYGLSNTLDAFILDLMGAGASASQPDNQIASAAINTAAGAYDLIVDMAVKLDESNTPQENRWIVVTPAFYGKLLKDARFVSSGDAAGAVARANGMVGEAAGLRVYRSNNLPVGALSTGYTSKLVIAGTTYATTLATQVRKVEAYRVELKFADGVKGLHVYGAKVVRPEGLVAADVVVS